MFNTKPRTTDSIIAPLLKIIKDLETHVVNQEDHARKCDEEIQSITAMRDFTLFDAEAAKKVMANVKAIVG